MNNMKKKILEAFIRDGFLTDSAKNLRDYEEDHPDDIWEYETLEEFLADQYDDDEVLNEELKGDQTKQFNIGDIIFTNAFYSPSSNQVVQKSAHSNNTSGHKIIVITSKNGENGVVYYRGFALTSNINNSNKDKNGYPNKLYIKNYGTILDRGPKTSMEAAVNINDLVKCNSRDLSPTGTYKGHVTDEFLQFLQTGYSNWKSHKDNSGHQWLK